MQSWSRPGRPGDIGATAVPLRREESAFSTGQVSALDGGWTAR